MMPNRRVKNCPALRIPKSKRPLVWNETTAPDEPGQVITKQDVWRVFEPYMKLSMERDQRERDRR